MVKFIGEYSAKVDDKGRVVFPSGLKDQLVSCSSQGAPSGLSGSATPKNGDSIPENVDWRFVVKKDLWEPCLSMYTFAEWERESEGIKAKINFLNRDQAAFWREYTRNRAIVVPDGKLSRMSVPKTLLESIGATKELVFCGSDHKIEIWGREQYEKSFLSSERFISLAEQISQK